MRAALRRTISIFLACVLVLSSLWVVPQQAGAEPSDGSFTSSGIASQIPVTLFNGEDAKDTMAASMQPGTITPGRVPTWDGHTFVHAWLKDPETPTNQIGIVELNFVEAGAQNGMPGGEAYVVVKPEHAQNDPFNLCIPVSKAAQFIFLEYTKVGKIIDVTYDHTNITDILVSGPSRIYSQPSGAAFGIFTVSVPRNYIPEVSVEQPVDVSIRKLADISNETRTIFRYEVKAEPQFAENEINITASAQKKDRLSITFSNSRPHDWQRGQGIGKYKDMLYGPASKTEYDYGDTVTFNVYHDKVEMSPRVYTVMMSALYLNGTAVPAPQPLARYGPGAYPANFSWTNPYNHQTTEFKGALTPPWYSPGTGARDLSFRVRACPYYVQSFSNAMSWDSYRNEFADRYGQWNFGTWWKSQIAGKVIDNQIFTHIDSGPLAGADVTIKVLDALPYCMGRELGDYKPGDQASTSSMKAWQYLNSNNGFGNSLRIAYQVTIENIPVSLTVDSEWATTNNVKVGIYENVGVENTQVYAGKVGASPNLERNFAWRNIPGPEGDTYVDIRALPGTDIGRYDRVVFNSNPSIKLRGNVSNGFCNPRPSSLSISVPGTKPLAPVTKGSDGYGYEVEIPVAATGGDLITSQDTNARVMFGGMSTVGVHASLMHIPLYFDLRGGTVESKAAFPAEGSGTPVLYDVETNPVARISGELPSRTILDLPSYALYWKLLYRDAHNKLIDTNKTFFAGSSFDIRDISQIGTRLSNKDGSEIVKSFVLQAVYEDSPENNPLVYRTSYHLVDDQTNRISTVGGPTFWAVKGIYVQPKPGAFRNEITQGNLVYHRDASYNVSQMILVGDNSKPAFVVPYHTSTEAQRWAAEHGDSSGRIATFEWGSTVDRSGLMRMIFNSSYLPDSVKIVANPTVDTYSSTIGGSPQMIPMTLTFSDGSQLHITGLAIVNTPNITGISTQNRLGYVLIGVLSATVAGCMSSYLYRRRQRGHDS